MRRLAVVLLLSGLVCLGCQQKPPFEVHCVRNSVVVTSTSDAPLTIQYVYVNDRIGTLRVKDKLLLEPEESEFESGPVTLKLGQTTAFYYGFWKLVTPLEAAVIVRVTIVTDDRAWEWDSARPEGRRWKRV